MCLHNFISAKLQNKDEIGVYFDKINSNHCIAYFSILLYLLRLNLCFLRFLF